MTDNKIKILLVDDHTLFRSGLRFLLETQKNFEIVGEASDGLEGIKLVEALHPDIVLLDLDMPIMGGREALAQLVNSHPDLIILVLTVSEANEDLIECMRLGAKGYLLKNIEADFLLKSINKALEGDSVLSPEMTTKLVNQLRKPDSQETSDKLYESLTPREMETLIWLTKGVSNKVIARSLNLTESTVKVHVQNILRKLNLHSRVQAAVYALENGLDKI
ncbi:MAG: response regulator transcription factor [Commensalibacter sp.]|nr:response regulator transcription factor [Commensalibacter sp.]